MQRNSALTLIEVLITIGIIVVLAGIIIAISPYIRDRAEAARCTNNLRQLQLAFSSYIQSEGHWPQEPPEFNEDTPVNVMEDWYIDALEPYGATEAIWRCPTIYRRVTSKSKDNRPKIHYSPTMFDELPGTPYKWPKQPWLIEIANMHGAGALVCFPDGSVRPFNELLKPQK